MKYIYSTPDVEVQKWYQEYRKEHGEEGLVDIDFKDDFSLLTAYTNRLLNPSDENPVNYEAWKLLLDTLRIKLALVKAQREEAERRERNRHLKSIPVADFDTAFMQVTGIALKFIPEESKGAFFSEMSMHSKNVHAKYDN